MASSVISAVFLVVACVAVVAAPMLCYNSGFGLIFRFCRSCSSRTLCVWISPFIFGDSFFFDSPSIHLVVPLIRLIRTFCSSVLAFGKGRNANSFQLRPLIFAQDILRMGHRCSANFPFYSSCCERPVRCGLYSGWFTFNRFLPHHIASRPHLLWTILMWNPCSTQFHRIVYFPEFGIF